MPRALPSRSAARRPTRSGSAGCRPSRRGRGRSARRRGSRAKSRGRLVHALAVEQRIDVVQAVAGVAVEGDRIVGHAFAAIGHHGVDAVGKELRVRIAPPRERVRIREIDEAVLLRNSQRLAPAVGFHAVAGGTDVRHRRPRRTAGSPGRKARRTAARRPGRAAIARRRPGSCARGAPRARRRHAESARGPSAESKRVAASHAARSSSASASQGMPRSRSFRRERDGVLRRVVIVARDPQAEAPARHVRGAAGELRVEVEDVGGRGGREEEEVERFIVDHQRVASDATSRDSRRRA